MASIFYEKIINRGADEAWLALRQVQFAHRLFADVLIDGRLDDDIRTVTFANGMVIRERIVDVSDERRRIAYSVISGTPMTHHNASMQLIPEAEDQCRFVWIADFLPDEFADQMLPLIQQGADALKRNLESGTA